MEKITVPTLLLSLCCFSVIAQDQDLLKFERNIEKAVVETNIPFLEKAYAGDFRFKHGTGIVDSKASWLKSVTAAKGQYISRVVDSVEVEIHDTIGITNGKITVTRKTDAANRVYIIKYVRVYLKRNEQWQLISHRTVLQINR